MYGSSTGLAATAGSLVAVGSASDAARGGLEERATSELALRDEPVQATTAVTKKSAVSLVDLALRIAAGDPGAGSAKGAAKNGSRRCTFKKPAASPAAAAASKSDKGVDKKIAKLVLGCSKCRGYLPLSCMTSKVCAIVVDMVCMLIANLLPLQRHAYMHLHAY
jgi:hypothetical protein